MDHRFVSKLVELKLEKNLHNDFLINARNFYKILDHKKICLYLFLSVCILFFYRTRLKNNRRLVSFIVVMLVSISHRNSIGLNVCVKFYRIYYCKAMVIKK